ncbi:hypothetical protein EUX98_g1825 [Antrodiella citrinella]|uniref:Uncharacterized protein n=1 Tax=Antrodiella citrinella TaxID=2447956 RepID=A0A4S4N0J1_9APHY|nr:hypothetical protein EUX98_g1825 [Antrodiella citrinella]
MFVQSVNAYLQWRYRHLSPQLLSNVLFITSAQLGGFRALALYNDIHPVFARVMVFASFVGVLWVAVNGQMARMRSINQWPLAAFASLVLYVKSVLLLYTLSRVHSTRMLLLLQYAPALTDRLLKAPSVRDIAVG